MGAWGIGVFENDDAGDWVYELSERGLDAVRDSLSVSAEDYLDALDGSVALAGAAVVTGLGLGADETLAKSPEVLAWLKGAGQTVPEPDWRSLVPAALVAVEAVRGDSSELRELWDESEELDAWLVTVTQVEQRLLSLGG